LRFATRHAANRADPISERLGAIERAIDHVAQVLRVEVGRSAQESRHALCDFGGVARGRALFAGCRERRCLKRDLAAESQRASGVFV
jgi:hypothetical protein